jgi:hypothetical protein
MMIVALLNARGCGRESSHRRSSYRRPMLMPELSRWDDCGFLRLSWVFYGWQVGTACPWNIMVEMLPRYQLDLPPCV